MWVVNVKECVCFVGDETEGLELLLNKHWSICKWYGEFINLSFNFSQKELELKFGI
jgi:hypothetical protein